VGYPEEDLTIEPKRKQKDQKAFAKICLMIKACAYAYDQQKSERSMDKFAKGM